MTRRNNKVARVCSKKICLPHVPLTNCIARTLLRDGTTTALVYIILAVLLGLLGGVGLPKTLTLQLLDLDTRILLNSTYESQ